MKFTKMSLVAALLVGSSAFAIENLKVSGDAKLFYTTQDSTYDETHTENNSDSLFDKSTSTGEVAFSIGATADLTTGVSAGATLNVVSSLGLYNNLVSSTWTGGTESAFVFSEAWLAGTTGNTTGKIGRMQLDTPLVFTETWSIVPSTFEAAVIINQDIPNTTVVGAYVGQYNANSVLMGRGLDNNSSSFESFYKGAYTIGAINNSWEPLTAQAWYYQAQSTLSSYWLQADLELSGIVAGLQYTANDSSNSNAGNDAFAVKVGYDMKDTFSAFVAYSQVGKDDNGWGAGANLAGSQSKLYTEAWWYYGVITQNDTDALTVVATTPIADVVDLGFYYTQATTKNGFSATEDADFMEATFEVAKSFGPLDTGLYYIYTKYDNENQKSATDKGDAFNTLQVYLTYNY